MKQFLTVLFVAFLCLPASSSYAKPKNRLSKITEGCKVTINYAVVADDVLVETSNDRGPMVFTVGEGTVLPGLEKAVIGMRMGEVKSFVLEPEDAYGKRTEPIRELPLSMLPPGVKPEKRMVLMLDDEEAGRKKFITIVEVKEHSVVVDFNHPLAGKELVFEVEVVDFDDPVSGR
jgi:FKBP-type peptidyl-prolyl cis-trans isomerase 2